MLVDEVGWTKEEGSLRFEISGGLDNEDGLTLT